MPELRRDQFIGFRHEKCDISNGVIRQLRPSSRRKVAFYLTGARERHLKGILYPERVEDTNDIVSAKEYLRLMTGIVLDS